MKEFIKKNSTVWVFILAFFIIENFSVCFTGGKPILTKFWYVFFTSMVFISVMLLIKNKKAKYLVGLWILILQSILSIGMVFLFESNGTYFDWGMLNQRSDAFGTIEDLSLNFGLSILCVLIVGAYVAFYKITTHLEYKRNNLKATEDIIRNIKEDKNLSKKEKKEKLSAYKKPFYSSSKLSKRVGLINSLMLIVSLALTIFLPLFDGVSTKGQPYTAKLYSSSYSKYQQYGITGNAFYEMVRGTITSGVELEDTKTMENSIYGDKSEDYKLETSEYFGISKDNNLIVVLVESFEWYAWLNDWYDQETLKAVYPNLYKFMGDSLVLDQFYAREKTDTSEILSILGSNPTNKYVHYDFPDNAYPFSLPNMFKENVEANGNSVAQCKSFHHNDGDFYNRNTAHEAFGFEELVDIKDMMKYGVVNTWNNPDGSEGERTLDSLAWEKMIDILVPEVEDDEKFFSYAITFAMHGFYKERENLTCGYKGENYYATLDKYGVYPEGLGVKEDYLRTYACALMDFDRAVGVLMKGLEDKNLLENTTVVLFSDHNTYYNNLSYHAKDIDEMYNSELYRVPCMIYDSKLTAAMKQNNQSTTISKFTTTADIVPTIFDLFGIRAWRNLYLGTSVFIEDIESIIFSRAYGLFVTDNIICYSINNPLYTSKNYNEEIEKDFINRAEKHLKRLEIIDKVYYGDYFDTNFYVRPFF